MDKNLNKLERLLALMDENSLTRAEFVSNFRQVIDFVKQAKQELGSYTEKECSDMIAMCEKTLSSVRNESSDDIAKIKKELDRAMAAKIRDIEGVWLSLSKKMEARMSELKDGRDADEQTVIDAVIARIPAPVIPQPETPEATRDKLETLQGEARLDASAIKGLEDRLKAIEGRTTTVITQNNAGGRNVQYYDLSDSLNGVLKTFSMPAFHRIIDVKLSSLPTLRPVIDYTVDGSAFSITFTDQVQASTDLSSGQSFIIIFSEN